MGIINCGLQQIMKFILSALAAFQLLTQTSAIVFNDCDFEKD